MWVAASCLLGYKDQRTARASIGMLSVKDKGSHPLTERIDPTICLIPRCHTSSVHYPTVMVMNEITIHGIRNFNQYNFENRILHSTLHFVLYNNLEIELFINFVSLVLIM